VIELKIASNPCDLVWDRLLVSPSAGKNEKTAIRIRINGAITPVNSARPFEPRFFN
jgi:hypothetical protein